MDILKENKILEIMLFILRFLLILLKIIGCYTFTFIIIAGIHKLFNFFTAKPDLYVLGVLTLIITIVLNEIEK